MSIPDFVDMRWLTLLFVLVLGGCNTEWQHNRERNEIAYSAVPANYKADILSFMRTYLNDPSGVRDAFLSEPSQQTIEGTSRYASCLRYNAKKTGGQYAGSKDSLVLFRGGRLDRVVDNARERCRDAAYKPFPELERLGR